MGQCESFCHTKQSRESLIKCTYFIKDYNETQIINNSYSEEKIMNEEISKKEWI